jgi:hypothetical protein
MNFKDLKQKMNAEKMDNSKIPTEIKDIKTSKMPIQKVIKSMRAEIFTQLVVIILFFAVPSFIELHQLPKGIYYILMSITSFITFIYLGKMIWFLNKSSCLDDQSKNSVITFIHDLKLTLEVYKTAVVSGSLLLPFPMICIYLGRMKMDPKLFENIVSLNISNTTLFLYAIGYIIVAILIYIITIMWSNRLYEIHIKNLEEILKEFKS